MTRPRTTSWITVAMGDFLATRREMLEASIADMARAASLRPSTVLRMEIGNRRVLNSTRDAICHAYGTTWATLREIDHEHNKRLGTARGFAHTMRKVYSRPNVFKRVYDWLGKTWVGKYCKALDLS